MPKSRPPYPAEFRQQMIELVRSGRSPAQLSREFGCAVQTIANGVAKADVDAGVPGSHGLTTANQAKLPVHTMCRMLEVSPSGFYAWRARPPSKRSIDDAVTIKRIRHFHAALNATYGKPRIRADLIEDGCEQPRFS